VCQIEVFRDVVEDRTQSPDFQRSMGRNGYVMLSTLYRRSETNVAPRITDGLLPASKWQVTASRTIFPQFLKAFTFGEKSNGRELEPDNRPLAIPQQEK
jgi:hypothetical protein